MAWVVPWSRYLDWFKPNDVDEDEHLINGLTCQAEVWSLAIRCPACGALYEIKGTDRRSRIFDRRRQRFRCSRCRFQAPVHVIVDCGLAPDEPERLNTQ
jgi:hypothetical protein